MRRAKSRVFSKSRKSSRSCLVSISYVLLHFDELVAFIEIRRLICGHIGIVAAIFSGSFALGFGLKGLAVLSNANSRNSDGFRPFCRLTPLA